MLAARMYEYHKPLVLEDIKVPEIAPDQVLVKVGGAGMCRSDVQLVDGYFAEALKPQFPITPGHEIAGLVASGAPSLCSTLMGLRPDPATRGLRPDVTGAAIPRPGFARQCDRVRTAIAHFIATLAACSSSRRFMSKI